MEIRGEHSELMLLRGVEMGAVAVAEGGKEATEVRVIMSSCSGVIIHVANVQNKDERYLTIIASRIHN